MKNYFMLASNFLLLNRSKAILLWWFLLFYVLVLIFVMLAPYVSFQIFGYVLVTAWTPFGKIAANSA